MFWYSLKKQGVKCLFFLSMLYMFVPISIYAQDCGKLINESKTRDVSRSEVDECLKKVFERNVEKRSGVLPSNFAEAELVFEGQVIKRDVNKNKHQIIYEIVPYTIFKGKTNKETIKIMASLAPKIPTKPSFEPTPIQRGEWSIGSNSIGTFFVKSVPTDSTRHYQFINPDNAWVLGTLGLVSLVNDEKFYKEVLYDKLTALSKTKYQRTAAFRKKKSS